MKSIYCENIEEIRRLGDYIGNYELLSFKTAVKTTKKQVLVQKGRRLSEKLLESLKARPAAELPDCFEFDFSGDLREQLKKCLARNIFYTGNRVGMEIRLEVLRLSGLDLNQLINAIFNDHQLLLLFMEMDQEKKGLIHHLAEVALFASSITYYALGSRNARFEQNPASFIRVLKTVFIGGLLHDIGWLDESYSRTTELFPPENDQHESRGKEFIRKNLTHLPVEIADIAGFHHRNEPMWQGKEGNKITNVYQLASEAIGFADYMLGEIYLTRVFSEENISEAEQVDRAFFNIGQSIGNGFFHPKIAGLVIQLNERIHSVMQYGSKIGSLEQECPYNSAIAYPPPKCSQILCRKRVYECRLIDGGRKITINRENVRFSTRNRRVFKGEYPKCKLAVRLPPYPVAPQ